MGVAVEIFQREASQLGFGVAAQPVNGALRNPGHDVGEHPGEPGGQKVDQRGEREDLTQLREVDATARHDVGSRHQVGDLTVALRPKCGEGLLLGETGGQALADDAVEDHVGGVADDFGPDHGAGDAAQREDGGNRATRPLWSKPGKELAQRLAQVFGLLRWEHPAETTRSAAKSSARWWPPAHVARHHATASSPSWDATISRYASV